MNGAGKGPVFFPFVRDNQPAAARATVSPKPADLAVDTDIA
jgi:hypothetical protein